MIKTKVFFALALVLTIGTCSLGAAEALVVAREAANLATALASLDVRINEEAQARIFETISTQARDYFTRREANIDRTNSKNRGVRARLFEKLSIVQAGAEGLLREGALDEFLTLLSSPEMFSNLSENEQGAIAGQLIQTVYIRLTTERNIELAQRLHKAFQSLCDRIANAEEVFEPKIRGFMHLMFFTFWKNRLSQLDGERLLADVDTDGNAARTLRLNTTQNILYHLLHAYEALHANPIAKKINPVARFILNIWDEQIAPLATEEGDIHSLGYYHTELSRLLSIEDGAAE